MADSKTDWSQYEVTDEAPEAKAGATDWSQYETKPDSKGPEIQLAANPLAPTDSASALTAAARNGLHGFSYGADSPIIAGGETALDKIKELLGLAPRKGTDKELYNQHLKEHYAQLAQDREQFPVASLTGDVAGSIASGNELLKGLNLARNSATGVRLLGEAAKAAPAAIEAAPVIAEQAPNLLNKGLNIAGEGLMKAGNYAAKELAPAAGVGALEGGAQGFGRSEKETTSGQLGDAVDTAAMGAVAGAGGKAALDGLSAIGNGVKNVANKVDVFKKLGNIAGLGNDVESAGVSLRQNAYGAKDAISNKEIELAKDASQATDDTNAAIQKAKTGAKDALQDSSIKAQLQLSADRNEIGQQIGELKKIVKSKVGDAIPVEIGRVDEALNEVLFDPRSKLGTKAQEIKNIIGEKPNFDSLDNAYNTLNKYVNSDKFHINDPETKKGLYFLRSQLKETVDKSVVTAAELHPELKDVAEELKNLNPQYSKSTIAEEKLFGGTPDLRNNMDIPMNADTGIGNMQYLNRAVGAKDAETQLANIRGIRNMAPKVEAAEKAAEQFQKFNVDNPVLGKMGTGPAEDQAALFKQSFGAPQDLARDTKGVPLLGKSMANMSDAQTPQMKQQADTIEAYIRKTYPEKAEQMLSELKNVSGKYKLLENSLDANDHFNQDISSKWRFLKKYADEAAYNAGKLGRKVAPFIPSQATATGAMNSLVAPVKSYKESVNAFKESQDPELNRGKSEQ